MNAVEQVGSGVRRIREICRDYGIAEPRYETTENWVTVTFKRPKLVDGVRIEDAITPEVTPEVIRMLQSMKDAMTRAEIMSVLGLKDEKHFRENYQQVAVSLDLLEMTIPDKPRSRLQKYRLTEKGRAVLAAFNRGDA